MKTYLLLLFFLFFSFSLFSQVEIDPDSSNFQSKVTIDNVLENNGMKYPQSDGQAGQFLGTDGAGELSWMTVSGIDGYEFISCAIITDHILTGGFFNFSSDTCGNLYDSGGPLGQYGNNEDRIFRILPANAIETRVIVQAVETEANRDTLWIKDIPFTGSLVSPDTFYFPGDEEIIIGFYSDNINTDDGFHISWDRLYYNGSGIAAPLAGFYFDPTKSSVGGGVQQDSSWSNSGERSVFFGYGSKGLGESSVAIGEFAEASGDYSTSVGYKNLAFGENSLAVGRSNESAESSTAVGFFNEVLGIESSAFGYFNSIGQDYSAALGYENTVTGENSSAIGGSNFSLKDNSHTMGYLNKASESNSLAIGNFCVASNEFSTALGYLDTAAGYSSIAIGYFNTANNTNSMAFGHSNKALGFQSMTFGNSNEATTTNTAAVGLDNSATDQWNSAFGMNNDATGFSCNAFGFSNTASKNYANAFGRGNLASGIWCSAFGISNEATSEFSTAFGYLNTASDTNSLAFGHSNDALGDNSSAFGYLNVASGDNSSAFGYENDVTAINSSAFGHSNEASGANSCAVGYSNEATMGNSVAIGRNNLVSATFSSSIGSNNTASGSTSAAIGISNNATGLLSTAFGFSNDATNETSSAFGSYNEASGISSITLGISNTSSGILSAAVGLQLDSELYKMMAVGLYNEPISGSATSWVATEPSFVVGIGENAQNTRNGMVILKNGNVGFGTNSPSAQLDVNGRIRFGDGEFFEDYGGWQIETGGSLIPRADNLHDLGASNRRWDDVYATNGTIQTSDLRDKTNIREISYGLNELMKLRAVSYNWKDDINDESKLGLIAQELLKVIPEVVKTHSYQYVNQDSDQQRLVENERMGVYYSDLIPVLIRSIQEQQFMIDKQQKEIEDQALQISRLEKLESQYEIISKRLDELDN